MSLAIDNETSSLGPAKKDILSDFKARTDLGRKLAELRAAVIDSGARLLDESQIDRELAERRGGLSADN